MVEPLKRVAILLSKWLSCARDFHFWNLIIGDFILDFFFQHCRFRYCLWCRSFAILGPLLRMRHGWIFPWQWHARSYHFWRFVQASRCLSSNVSPFETSPRSWGLPWWRFLPSLPSLGESRQDERHPRRWILDRPSHYWDTSKLATPVTISTFQEENSSNFSQFFSLFFIGRWCVRLYPNQRHFYHWRTNFLGDRVVLQRYSPCYQRRFVCIPCRICCPN